MLVTDCAEVERMIHMGILQGSERQNEAYTKSATKAGGTRVVARYGW